MKKKRKTKKINKTPKPKSKTTTMKISDNQLESLDQWLTFYKKNQKLPHKRVVCSHCKNDYASMKGLALAHAKKHFNGDIKRILTESLCKVCKEKLHPKEKKKYEPKILTREEMEARAEEIKRNLPKIDFHKAREPIDMVKNKKVCAEVTSFACWRPDIYLNLGCSECSLVKNCACPIKNLKRKPTARGRKTSYAL
jgi:hypothetical protein